MRYNIELKAEIEEQKLTQVVLANKIGRHDSFISMLIKGRINPTKDEKKIVAKALGVKVSKIFTSN